MTIIRPMSIGISRRLADRRIGRYGSSDFFFPPYNVYNITRLLYKHSFYIQPWFSGTSEQLYRMHIVVFSSSNTRCAVKSKFENIYNCLHAHSRVVRVLYASYRISFFSIYLVDCKTQIIINDNLSRKLFEQKHLYTIEDLSNCSRVLQAPIQNIILLDNNI